MSRIETAFSIGKDDHTQKTLDLRFGFCRRQVANAAKQICDVNQKFLIFA